MPDFLETIVADTRRRVAEAAARVPLDTLREAAESVQTTRRSFAAAVSKPDGVRVIAEIKRASPSKGLLRPTLDPAALARAYAAGGAAALSVLTEPTYFLGSPDDLQAARAATSLPVLRKDFILDPYQVYESAVIGADAILLIVRILDDDMLVRLQSLACALGLDTLVEVHDAAGAQRAAALGARLVGINNRDLSSFTTDTDNAARLAAVFSPETCVVAASGIQSRDDIERYERNGIHGFLVGELLVRAADPVTTLRLLCGGATT